MKTIGMIGGTGWVSTVEYYRLLNEEVNRRLGGVEAARCILYSLNMGDVARLKERDPEQAEVGQLLLVAARALHGAGAECLALCANTLHLFADAVGQAVPLPLVHIATATAAEISRQGLRRVGLLGTRMTMEKDFYRRRLEESGIATLVPEADDRAAIDRAIMTEMIRGDFRPQTRQRFQAIMSDLAGRGAQGIVLGCTEIPLLMAGADPGLPLFDTLAIHVRALADFALDAQRVPDCADRPVIFEKERATIDQ